MSIVLDKDTRIEMSKKILKDLKYENIVYVNSGGFNTVFSCKNPKSNQIVAAKVVISKKGDSIRAVEKEKQSVDELRVLMPKGWDENKKAFTDSTIAKSEKHYFKYLNKPVFKGKDVLKEINNEKIEEEFEYVVLEAPLVKGDLWDTFMKVQTDNKNIDFVELRKISKNALKALNVLHSKNRAHLDVKPQNILRVTGESGHDIFQLCDFGSMENINEESLTDRLGSITTLEYQSPEVLDNQEIKKDQITKIDIYGLAASLMDMYLSRKNEKISSGGDAIKFLLDDLHESNNQYLKDAKDNKQELIFLDFIKFLSEEDPEKRPSAAKALGHKFLNKT